MAEIKDEPGTVGTSGNWYVRQDDAWLVFDEHGPIASISRWRVPEIGFLIAAAPKLLAVLEETTSALQEASDLIVERLQLPPYGGRIAGARATIKEAWEAGE